MRYWLKTKRHALQSISPLEVMPHHRFPTLDANSHFTFSSTSSAFSGGFPNSPDFARGF
jgi:hypothetical protein